MMPSIHNVYKADFPVLSSPNIKIPFLLIQGIIILIRNIRLKYNILPSPYPALFNKTFIASLNVVPKNSF